MDKRFVEIDKQLAIHAERFKSVRTDMNALHEAYKAEAANFRAEMQAELRLAVTEMQKAVVEIQKSAIEMQKSLTDMQRSLTDMQKGLTDMQQSLIAHTRWTVGFVVAAVVVMGVIVRWPAAG